MIEFLQHRVDVLRYRFSLLTILSLSKYVPFILRGEKSVLEVGLHTAHCTLKIPFSVFVVGSLDKLKWTEDGQLLALSTAKGES